MYCLSIGLVLRGVMLGVSLTNGQPIVAVDNYATFLHDAVGALGTRLFNIPDHLLVNTLHRQKTQRIYQTLEAMMGSCYLRCG